MRNASGWIIALGGTAAVTAIGRVVHLNSGTAGFAFLIVVLFGSLRGGLVAGAAASVVATLCYNFFFFEPLHTFSIAEPANWIALAAFLVTSVIVSRLVIAARIQAERAEQGRTELETLYGLSVELFTATNRTEALDEAARRALERLGARDVEVVLGENANDGEATALLKLPLVVGGRTVGMLVARGADASMQALESAARLVSLAIEREKFIEENAHVQALRESETLKTSLLRAISHDLTTPLTAITIHLETLRRNARDAELREAVAGISGEAGRLRRRIDNLLSMARLEAGKAKPRREPTPPADLFHAVRENLPLVFQSRPVIVHVDDDCPDANVDPSLALEILVNLIENAHRVSPAGVPLELLAHVHPDDDAQVRIEVLDRGPGLPAGVALGDLAQLGLGLEIARSLAAANGGSIAIEPRQGDGTIVRLDVPAAPLPPHDA